MARRASKKINMGTLIGIIAGILACLVAIIVLSQHRDDRKTGSLADFPVKEYFTRASSLRDNTYNLSGRVEERAPRPGAELVILVVKGEDGVDVRLPVIIPQDIKSINIEREQEYNFQVKVVNMNGGKGLLRALSVTAVR